MKRIFNKKIGKIFLLLAFLGVGFFLLFCNLNNKKINTVFANINDNVNGSAWSSNYGWISFNSTICDTGCIGPNCNSDGSLVGCPVANYPDYGVKIDQATGNFSGYAWSSNLGWISFQANKTIGDITNITSHCDPSCVPASGCTACISGSNIYGWAKILALGDDGWIRFDDDGGGFNYGLTVSTAGADQGDFMGWAWNGNDSGAGIGWISFNSLSPGSGGGNYKVHTGFSFNNPPDAINLAAPNLTNSELCFSVKQQYLQWDFDDPGDSESAYEIILDDDSNMLDDTPELDTLKCLGQNNPSADCKISLGADNYAVHNAPAFALIYGQQYWWWVRVWDSHDVPSVWRSGPSFTVSEHEYPDVDFTFFPASPSIGESVQFTDASAGNGASITEWLWSFNNGAVVPPSANSDQNPIASFTAIAGASATLTATDSDNYSCTLTLPVTAKKKIPTWIEKK